MNTQTKIKPDVPAYHSDTYVYFDLETLPCQDEDYLLELERKVKAPATFKKPESIAEWLSKNRKSAALEAMGKTSFDGGRGHICSIAWAKNDSPITCEHAKTVGDEKRIIEAFFADLDPFHSETLVGHNISGFDLEFLRKRAVVLGVRLPDRQSFARDPKPWDASFHDTMTMWAGGKGRVSMDELCKVLGIKGKEGFDGSMVAEAWANGDHDTIAEYCKDDVWRTREIHKRFLAVSW
jgi:DNA polymerase elongation subunit (family B)